MRHVDEPVYIRQIENEWEKLKGAYERAKGMTIYDVEGNEVQPALTRLMSDIHRATLVIQIECEHEEVRRARAATDRAYERIEVMEAELGKLS